MMTETEQKTSKVLYFYHPDHLGSTSMVTNYDGEVTQNVAYIPYGEVFVEERNGSWSTPFLFNAKELDEETGLYYYGARYLDPVDARWLSPDPMFEKYVGMSPYNYCAGNPVKMVDPDGRDYLQTEEGQMLYFSYDLEEKGAKIGEKFSYEVGGKTYSGIYRGKTYDDGKNYYSLFGQKYDSKSKDGMMVKALDRAIDQYCFQTIEYKEKFSMYETDYSYSFDFSPGFSDINKSCYREENIHYISYANLASGDFFNFDGNMTGVFGLTGSPMFGVPIVYRSFDGPVGIPYPLNYYLFARQKGQTNPNEICHLNFGSKNNANEFLKKLYNLYPSIGRAFKEFKF